jgi:hypothetical protein
MFVRVKYFEFGKEKGYTMWAKCKEDVLANLRRVGCSVDMVTSLEVCKPGEKEFKSYNPKFLR